MLVPLVTDPASPLLNCASPSNNLISLSYSMPVFSANLFRTFIVTFQKVLLIHQIQSKIWSKKIHALTKYNLIIDEKKLYCTDIPGASTFIRNRSAIFFWYFNFFAIVTFQKVLLIHQNMVKKIHALTKYNLIIDEKKLYCTDIPGALCWHN